MTESLLPPPSYKDRRGGLIAFGIISILMGLGCALLVPVMVLSQLASAKMTGMTTPWRFILPGVGLYGGLAVTLIWLGIGSIQCRRWARDLLLILGWGWLLVGLMALLVMGFVMPRIFAHPPAGAAAPPEVIIRVMMITAMVIMSVFMVALPGSLVLFYRSRHVRATCEARDPVRRWTDACPLPVLGLSLMLGYGALCILMLPLFNGVMPFFGRFISGAPGMAMALALSVVWGWSAWAVYRLQPAAWWTVLGVMTVMAMSTLLTFGRVDIMEMYQVMGYPEEQIKLMRQFDFLKGSSMQLLSVSGFVPVLGFLIWVRKYFDRPAAA